MKSDYVRVDEGMQYAQDVVAGDIVACKYVIQACQRQLNDLEKKSWEYSFDKKRAERAIKFIELLPHTKGMWAQKRQRLVLSPWQKFIIATAFGWVKKSGARRFSECYVEVPRKNGKSAKAAGIGLYCFAADGEYGAEVYSGATSEKQAWEVFKPARLMSLKTPALTDHFGIEINAKSLSIVESGAKFEPLIGKPGDGASPSCAIVDEYHEHDTPDLYDTMLTGMGARTQPLMFIITTAGSNIAGPCYDKRAEVVRMLDGVYSNDELFGIIYTIDEGDDWTSPAALRKANPNIGISVSEDFLLARQREAVASSTRQNVFKTKHLNMWVSAHTAWMNMETWLRCGDTSLRREQFVGCPVYIALDLASKIDIAANVQLFTKVVDGVTHYYVFGNYYLPETTVADPKNKHYVGWQKDGYLTVTDGDEIDFAVIREDVKDLLSTHEVREIPYDPWRATQLAQEISAEGGLCVEYRNTVQLMSMPMKELEAAIVSGRLHHDGNPVLTWMMSNVVAKIDAKDNIYPRKEKPERKIDGVVALIMAIGRAIANVEQEATVYESRGITLL